MYTIEIRIRGSPIDTDNTSDILSDSSVVSLGGGVTARTAARNTFTYNMGPSFKFTAFSHFTWISWKVMH